MSSRLRIFAPATVAAVLALGTVPAIGADSDRSGSALGSINHIVVIYQENHSFDNLYGGWERVNGLSRADAAHTQQIKQSGATFSCLLQDDVNLAAVQPSTRCQDTKGTSASPNSPFTSYFFNAPFAIDDYISPTDKTCPAPGVFAPNGVPRGTGQPGGCTRDLVHRFYQEQYQLNNGQQNRYTQGSDAVGLTQGYYTTTSLPIYQYLHQQDHPHYAIADKFFQAAFGGSFLNHQWLIAAATPSWPQAPASQHSVIDSNGMPTSYPLYTATPPTSDQRLTRICPAAGTIDPNPGKACGDYAVNTIQPAYQPFKGTPQLPPQTVTTDPTGKITGKTIGDELSAAGVSWAWYSGGWSNADGRVGDPGWTNGNGTTCIDPGADPVDKYPFCADKLFQYHHQPFNYFSNYGRLPNPTTGSVADGPEKPARIQHLRDEAEFLQLLQPPASTCNLKSVSFVKPIGEDNEHPGYTGESQGSRHLLDLIKAIENSACRKDTMIVTTYDEFGGSWDHVSPPGQGSTDGVFDQWGPGTRIPALVISPFLNDDFVVDHVPHDTTSILATIEHRFGLPPLGTRDAAVRDLSSVYHAQ
jgi:phospholipase C